MQPIIASLAGFLVLLPSLAGAAPRPRTSPPVACGLERADVLLLPEAGLFAPVRLALFFRPASVSALAAAGGACGARKGILRS